MGVGLATGLQLAAFRRSLGAFGPAQALFMSATMEARWLETVDHPAPTSVFTPEAADLAAPELAKRRHATKRLRRAKTALARADKSVSSAKVAAENPRAPCPGLAHNRRVQHRGAGRRGLRGARQEGRQAGARDRVAPLPLPPAGSGGRPPARRRRGVRRHRGRHPGHRGGRRPDLAHPLHGDRALGLARPAGRALQSRWGGGGGSRLLGRPRAGGRQGGAPLRTGRARSRPGPPRGARQLQPRGHRARRRGDEAEGAGPGAAATRRGRSVRHHGRPRRGRPRRLALHPRG